ncbi:MAG: hypothetical protein LAO03_15995 [Acidobacteriia bacterium]|nr:hypothetical protein [Terriglobia bacterium]
MKIQRFRSRLLSSGLLVALAASGAAGQVSPLSPDELVRRAVQNEIKSKDDPAKFMFRDHKKRISDDQTKLIVETRDGAVGMVVALNGQPLSPQQHQWEIARIERFVKDSNELRKKQQQEKDDADRASRIIKALPDAFQYEFDGTETSRPGVGKPGEELVRLKFRPNPKYDPPTRVEQILTGMQGSALVDAKRNRMVRIEGTLFKDVGFGWGLLGHLDRGGHIYIEQAEVSENTWQITAVQYTFTGKVLLFKNINVKTTETLSDFRPVPPDLTFAQGLALLKEEDSVAENHPQSK